MKQQFRDQYAKSLESFGEIKKMVVAVKLPTGATELIINTENIETKFEYYMMAYDMEMKLNTNPEIQIVGVLLV